jgi:RimJ/RimL family protein N-acetyltransferase
MSLRRLFPIATLTSAHVTLRRPHSGDAETIGRYIGDQEAEAWLSGSENADHLYAEYIAGWNAPDETNRFGLTLIVTRADNDTLVGVIHLQTHDGVLHVGYGVAPDHRRAGIASRALALCSAWGIENGFSRVELEIGEDNTGSQAVARSCGFKPTSRTRTQVLPDGGEWHARAWCLEP